jgi:hypothetical protein
VFGTKLTDVSARRWHLGYFDVVHAYLQCGAEGGEVDGLDYAFAVYADADAALSPDDGRREYCEDNYGAAF